MKATAPGAFRAQTPVLFDRASDFIARNTFERPTLVLELDRVGVQYDALKSGLGDAHIHYAVKANPDPRIIALLVAKGSHFDCASRAEIELCLAQGARADQISFGNTIKRGSDIAFAASQGVMLFAADAPEELEKMRGYLHEDYLAHPTKMSAEFRFTNWEQAKSFYLEANEYMKSQPDEKLKELLVSSGSERVSELLALKEKLN